MNSSIWKDKMKSALRSTKELNSFFETEFPETPFPVFLPIDLAEKIKKQGAQSALGKQFLPHVKENNTDGLFDPIGDEIHSPIAGLVHRYGNRALFFPTKACPVICRYCFRKNELSENQELFKVEMDKTVSYLREHPEINEIILSGGDPLTLDDKNLFKQIATLAEVPTIKYLRFHTRFPVIIPERIDNQFLEMMKLLNQKFKVVHFVLHTNHSDELSPIILDKLKEIQRTGTKVLSQTVLLKDINNSNDSLSSLFLKLSENGVQPYYLHHPDQVKGGMHFRLSIEEGRSIYNSLRQTLPGWAIPQYVVDLPDGKGKVPAFNPESLEFKGRLIDRFGQHQDYSSP
jgi:lysine 2,3-aminomutase